MAAWKLVLLSAFALSLFTSCERPKDYAYWWSELFLLEHGFSHSLHLEDEKVHVTLRSPQAYQLPKFPGLWVAFHFQVNHGEVVTRFLRPVLPTQNLQVQLPPLRPGDKLSYYFSYVFYHAEKNTQMTIDSGWFHHLVPQNIRNQSHISIKCRQHLGLTKIRPPLPIDRDHTYLDERRSNSKATCQPGV